MICLKQLRFGVFIITLVGCFGCADVVPDFIDGGENLQARSQPAKKSSTDKNPYDRPKLEGGEKVITDPSKLTEDFVPGKNTRVKLSEDEWKEILTDEEFRILRKAGTEAKGSGKHIDTHKKGFYHCAACGAPLYKSDTKFGSKAHGWPSYYKGIPGRVGRRPDHSLGMDRTEVYCNTCGSHLGHVFQDAPEKPTGERHCINSVALDFSSN